VLRKRPNLHATDQDRPYRASFAQQRSGKGGSLAVLLGVSCSFRKIPLRRLQVRDVDSGPIKHGSARDPIAAYWQLISHRQLAGWSMPCYKAQHITLDAHDLGVRHIE